MSKNKAIKCSYEAALALYNYLLIPTIIVSETLFTLV